MYVSGITTLFAHPTLLERTPALMDKLIYHLTAPASTQLFIIVTLTVLALLAATVSAYANIKNQILKKVLFYFSAVFLVIGIGYGLHAKTNQQHVIDHWKNHSKLVYHDHQLIFTSKNPYLKSQKLKVLATYDDKYIIRYQNELYEVNQHDISN
jgi:hypothetical protein